MPELIKHEELELKYTEYNAERSESLADLAQTENIQWQPEYAEQMEQTERESTNTEHNGEMTEWQPKYAK